MDQREASLSPSKLATLGPHNSEEVKEQNTTLHFTTLKNNKEKGATGVTMWPKNKLSYIMKYKHKYISYITIDTVKGHQYWTCIKQTSLRWSKSSKSSTRCKINEKISQRGYVTNAINGNGIDAGCWEGEASIIAHLKSHLFTQSASCGSVLYTRPYVIYALRCRSTA